MISIAQAFRVWKWLFQMPSYPFPPEAKRIRILLIIVVFVAPFLTMFSFLGFTITTDVQAGLMPKLTPLDLLGLLLPPAWAVSIFYAAAVLEYWQGVGRDRWLNEDRLCRSCGAKGPRARVDRYEVTARFREARKEYDRLERARRRGQRGRIVEGA